MRIVSRLRDAFEVEVPVRQIIAKPTVAGVAAHIEQRAVGCPSESSRMTGKKSKSSLSHADDLIRWLRSYARRRINSHLIDEHRSIPPHVVLDFGNHGLLGLQVPATHAGLGLPISETLRVLEQMGGIDLTLASFVTSHMNGVHCVERFAPEGLRDELLPRLARGREIAAFAITEARAGSNPRDLTARAVPAGRGGWRLEGSKIWVDHGSWAGALVVFVQLDGRGITGFVLSGEGSGVRHGREALTMGLRGQVQSDLHLDGVRVGPEQLLGSPGEGMEVIRDTMAHARLRLAAKSVGAMKRCSQLMHRYASRRHVITGRLWDNPVTLARFSSIAASTTAIETLASLVASDLDAGAPVPDEIFSACKVAASDAVWKAADVAVQILGGRGYMEPNALPQILRDARTLRISEGPNETLAMYVGSSVLHAGAPLREYLDRRLGQPAVAGKLEATVHEIDERCRSAPSGSGVPSARQEWSYGLAGDVTISAILLAAALHASETDASARRRQAAQWARQDFERICKERSLAASGHSYFLDARQAGELVSGYAEAIGEIEQTLPGEEHDLDDWLRLTRLPRCTQCGSFPETASRQAVDHAADGRAARPTDARRHQSLVEWNDTRQPLVCLSPGQRPSGQGDVGTVLEAQVGRTPEAVAVVFEDCHLSYRELNRRANQLARHLRSLGVGHEDLVAVVMDRGPEMLIALGAVLKAGGAYVPLDPGGPANRLALILEDSKPGVLLTQARLVELAPPSACEIVAVDREAGSIGRCSGDDLPRRQAPEQLAYVVYTSGSTGTPKGTQISHRALLNVLESLGRRPGLGRDDVWLAVTTLAFDIAALELFLPLATGARILLADREAASNPARLSELLCGRRATVVQATPATWRLLFADGWTGCGRLKLLCGGEMLPRDLAERLRATGSAVWNMYGPTETTIWSTCHRWRGGPAKVAIGRGLSNTRVYVTDARLRRVDAGEPGELCIGGFGLARGYLGRPGSTADRFVPDPLGPEPGERIYKTGDRVRQAAAGVLEISGRLDRQLKVRGVRIEPGEVEAVLRRHGRVEDAVIVARAEEEGLGRLVAYLVAPDGPPPGAELQRFCRERLPDEMIPSTFVVLERLPLNPNGKVDLRALPPPGRGRPELVSAYVEPATATEKLLAELWSDLLKVEPVGVEDDFFELGGHSILATQLVARLRDHLQVELALTSLFEASGLKELARKVSELTGRGPEPAGRRVSVPTAIPRTVDHGDVELSHAQERIWFVEQYEGSGATYNRPLRFRLEGPLELRRLRHCFDHLLRRHESLRTVFTQAEGRPRQRVLAEVPSVLRVVDFSRLGDDEGAAAMDGQAAAAACRPFDLRRGPLVRAVVLRSKATCHDLVLVLHHIVSDGWSDVILLHELSHLYAAFGKGRPSPLAPPAIRYVDFAVWQRRMLETTDLEPHRRYWREKLDGLTAMLDLPLDRPRPALQTYRGACRGTMAPAGLESGIEAVCRQEGVTSFMVFLATFQVLLHRWAGQADIAAGTPIAGRTHSETEELIGLFVNTLVIRTDLSGNPPLRDVLRQVRTSCLEAYDHQVLPFEKLVQDLDVERDRSRNALFQVMFAQNPAGAEPELTGLHVRKLELDNRSAKFDLTLSMDGAPDETRLRMEYCTDLFDRATIEQLLDGYLNLLRAAARDTAAAVGDLPLLAPAQRHQILCAFNDTRAPYPEISNVADLLGASVHRYPDRVALEVGDERISYRQLDRLANATARRLRALGVSPDALVGLSTEPSVEMFVGLLGILKAAGAYLPLDPALPSARVAWMIEDAKVRLVLANEHLKPELAGCGAEVLCLDTRAARPPRGGSPGKMSSEGLHAAGRGPRPRPENLAYVIYTSGSTGRPKAVAVQHRVLSNLFQWHRATLLPNARTLQLASVSFDASLHEMFAAWGSAGTLCVASGLLRRDIGRLGRFLDERNVAKTILPVVVLSQMAHLPGVRPGSLREVTTTGEQLRINGPIRDWFAGAVRCAVHNHYGPSETHVVTAYTLAEDPGRWPPRPPIGHPIANCQVHVLDEALEPVPLKVRGEIYAGGAGVARGYLHRPALSAERFLPDPFSRRAGARLYRTGDQALRRGDGCIEFLRRLDGQLKIRGFRVEPGEVEAVLGRHSGVREQVVVARDDAAGGARLVAYLVTDPRRGEAVSSIRRFLAERLPEYMIPSTFVPLHRLPLTPNGKVDYGALPSPGEQRPASGKAYTTPRSGVEETVAGIWVRLLGLERIGRDDDFFELGGHSLLAMQAVFRVNEAFRVDLTVRDLFDPSAATVAGLSRHIESILVRQPCPVAVPAEELGEREEIEL